MFRYIKKYLIFAILAVVCMFGEVFMDLYQPELMSRIVDEGVLGIGSGGVSNLEVILVVGLMMAVITFLGGLCGSLNNVFIYLTSENTGNEIRKDTFRKIMSLSFSQVETYSTGALITRVTNDITQVQSMVSQSLRGLIRTVMLVAGSVFFLFRMNVKFGLVVLIVLPFMILCIVLRLTKSAPVFAKLQKQVDEINNIMQEDVAGIRIIKACVKEIYEKVRFGKANDELVRTHLKALFLFAFVNPVVNSIMYIAIAAILLISSYEVSTGGITPGDILAAITYLTRMLNGILMLVVLFQNFSRGAVSWGRVKEVLSMESDLKDGPFDGDTKEKGTIEFKNVSFTYPGMEKPVLHDISLKVESGETLGIMGATGCGKTSLISLIPRFYDVAEGQVLVDGIDVREYKRSALMDRIGFVFQKSELFAATVLENISWGCEDASIEQVERAARLARAEEFILKMPKQYESDIAQKGMSLSGGQKQRISIARAMMKPCEILILDDATSALDLKTEADFYKGLNKENPGLTKVIVAQRVSSVKNADKILILDGGTIADCGTHEELMKRCHIYKDIYDSQVSEIPTFKKNLRLSSEMPGFRQIVKVQRGKMSCNCDVNLAQVRQGVLDRNGGEL
ncbi:MAG: ABC transporter ATP-binding protein [Lachnospiraceae bacterium]|nr:ABC transporter ATP-binding protein [Lachnospiraceae bacterium]